MPDFGDGSPREDYGAVDQYAPSVANGQISPAQWSEYQKKRHLDALRGLLGTFGMTTGLGALGGALGGAGGAAANSSLPAVEGGSPWAVTPYATTATMSAPGAAAGAGVGAGVGAGAAAGGFMGMSPQEIAALATSLAGTVGGALSKGPDQQPNYQTTDPQMQKLIGSMQGRLDQSEPLYKSIMAMANGLLPTQYQNGGAGR